MLDSQRDAPGHRQLTERELVFAILRWSALPGASRHHWGTDLDVFDAAARPEGYEIELIPEEVDPGGMFGPLHDWLDEQDRRIGRPSGSSGPYDLDRDGVAPERWHLSCGPVAGVLRAAAHPRAPAGDDPRRGHRAERSGLGASGRDLRPIRHEHREASRMRLRSRQEIGTISMGAQTPTVAPILGIPLEVWRPAGSCKLLIHAGIHGEEGETTVALSRALRLISEPSPHCAVVLAANPDGLIRGTRGNARGVDLNRNFPTQDWSPDPVMHRSTLDDAQGRGSEPRLRAGLGAGDQGPHGPRSRS